MTFSESSTWSDSVRLHHCFLKPFASPKCWVSCCPIVCVTSPGGVLSRQLSLLRWCPYAPVTCSDALTLGLPDVALWWMELDSALALLVPQVLEAQDHRLHTSLSAGAPSITWHLLSTCWTTDCWAQSRGGSPYRRGRQGP